MNHHLLPLNRRQFCATTTAAVFGSLATPQLLASESFQLNYMLPSCMYGYLPLAEILPEAKKIGATQIDIWPKVHGNQREQLDEMGEAAFGELLQQHQVKLGCITQYKLGPFGLQEEMKLAQRFGCKMLVTGGSGPKGLVGAELKAAVKEFLEKMKPHIATAEETGVIIAIENHANNLIESPDSLKWLVELRSSPQIQVAFAPYHLPQDSKLLAQLIRDLGHDGIAMFYAWQHGMGCMKKLPKEQELLQMPGRGELDFTPLLAALKEIQYDGWTEIFMHPVPRGIPIQETAAGVSEEINRSRYYLSECLQQA